MKPIPCVHAIASTKEKDKNGNMGKEKGNHQIKTGPAWLHFCLAERFLLGVNIFDHEPPISLLGLSARLQNPHLAEISTQTQADTTMRVMQNDKILASIIQLTQFSTLQVGVYQQWAIIWQRI